MRSRRASSSTGTAGAAGATPRARRSSPCGAPGPRPLRGVEARDHVAVGEPAVGAQRLAPGVVEVGIGGARSGSASGADGRPRRARLRGSRSPATARRAPPRRSAAADWAPARAPDAGRPARAMVARTRSSPTVRSRRRRETRAQRLGNADRERHLDAGASEVASGRHRCARRASPRRGPPAPPRSPPPSGRCAATRRAGARDADPLRPPGSGRRPAVTVPRCGIRLPRCGIFSPRCGIGLAPGLVPRRRAVAAVDPGDASSIQVNDGPAGSAASQRSAARRCSGRLTSKPRSSPNPGPDHGLA